MGALAMRRCTCFNECVSIHTDPFWMPGPVTVLDRERLTDFVMLHRLGLLAVEKLVLQRELTTRAMFLLQAMVARMNTSTGRVWSSASELAAEHQAVPGCVCSSIRRLRRAGLVVRCTAPPLDELSAKERASMPDPASRAPHSARLYFLIHPGLASVGGKTRRGWVLDQFQAAIGDRLTPFARELAAIEDEARELELTAFVEQATGSRATPAGMGARAAA